MSVNIFIDEVLTNIFIISSDSGYVLGIIGTIIIGILCNCCIHMLVEINELFCAKPDEPPFDYEEVKG